MKTVVTAYSVLIGFMAWRSLDGAFVDNATLSERFYSISAGLVFVISDLTLAIDKFVSPIQNQKLYVLSTYFAAQYFFVQWAICKAERSAKRVHKNK